MTADFTRSELTDIFDFLDDLRAGGTTNMFGAGTHVQMEFDLDRSEAAEAVSLWMRFFSEAPARERAEAALA